MRGFTSLLLAPVLIAQGLWTALRATRLPEAAGPREGRMGQGPPLRILVTGDSSAAGVGADTQINALVGQLAQHLADDFDVTWQVVAKSGGTAASTRQMLHDTPPQPCDVAVVALGVNDTKNGVSLVKWRAAYAGLMDDLHDHHGARHIYVSGLPPLGEFPLLPSPLRGVLGRRALTLDGALRVLADTHATANYVEMVLPMDTSLMADDGFHPGPLVYAGWAGLIADQIKRDLASGETLDRLDGPL